MAFAALCATAALFAGVPAARIRATDNMISQPCFCGVPKDSALLVLDMQNDFLHANGSMTIHGGLQMVPAINELAARPGWAMVGYTQDEHAQNSVTFASAHGKMPFEQGTLTYSLEGGHSNKLCGEEFMERYGAHSKMGCAEGDNLVHFPQTFWPDHCVNGTWGQQLVSDLALPSHAVAFAKRGSPVVDGYSAFQNVLGAPWTDLAERLGHAGVKNLFLAGVAQDLGVHYTARDAVRRGYQTFILSDATTPATDGGLLQEEILEAREKASAKNRKVGAMVLGAKDMDCCA